MSVIDNITKHFNDALENNLIKHHVPEWDTDIYYYPTYSFKNEQKIMELQSKGKTVDALVESILVKCLDANGKRLFTDANRAQLMNEADPKLIIRVAGAINTGIPDEEYEKN
jgi:hypothetical protein